MRVGPGAQEFYRAAWLTSSTNTRLDRGLPTGVSLSRFPKYHEDASPEDDRKQSAFPESRVSLGPGPRRGGGVDSPFSWCFRRRSKTAADGDRSSRGSFRSLASQPFHLQSNC